jgi:hypothetical protein
MEDARMPPYADNPALWRQRAQEARIQAEQMGDAEAREQMLTIARDYDRLAELAEQRLVEASQKQEQRRSQPG